MKEQQDIAREERKIAREAEQKAREHEEKMRAEQFEREDQKMQAAEREAERQRQEAERQRQEAEKQRQAAEKEAERQLQEAERQRAHELEVLRIKTENGNGTPAGQGNSTQHPPNTAKPKLPRFDEKHDDMDTFIERFERFAESQGWKRDEWAVCLSPLLTGKGLQVFSSMPSDEALNYDSLKRALLKRY